MIRHKILITYDDGCYSRVFSEPFIRKCIDAALDCEGVFLQCEVSVLITGDEAIHRINREFRSVDRATDVLSFPLQNFVPEAFDAEITDLDRNTGLLPIGDIVISVDHIRAQALEYGHSRRRELAYLLVPETKEPEKVAELDDRLLDGYGALAVGDTDSEQVVIFLVDALDDVAERKGAPLTFGERFVILSHAVEELSANNKLNLVIDDGAYTYVHTNTVEPTLYVQVQGETAIFCTRPLDDDGWEPLPQNRLIAYRDGHMERMGARHDHSIDEAAYFRAISQL